MSLNSSMFHFLTTTKTRAVEMGQEVRRIIVRRSEWEDDEDEEGMDL